ncbi:hypothetical protein CDD81_7450 [Ophiocordyceps australis]|uniref:Protein CMS1 n=1 Tax=Ophiocordyceps australis TaxID=1399860 RepID=A0A2C5YA68_9HYPO|nr:hypothetical protein CDD81_7450 [Ophiocordyceps australis]
MSSKKRSAEQTSASGNKRPRKKAKAQFEDEMLDTELGINTLFSHMDNHLMADYLAQKTANFGSELSNVELSDLAVPENSIIDTTSWQEKRTLEHLPDFLQAFSPGTESLRRPPQNNGSPHTLIVTGAGLRAANIVRAVRQFSAKDNMVAKLFAKHIKMVQQVAFLQGHKTGIGVGTPARLEELIDNGALSLENLQRLVVDASHIDQKKRGILDMKDTAMPLARFVARAEFKRRYGHQGKPLALLFY